MSKRQRRARQKDLRHTMPARRPLAVGGVALAATLISGSVAEANAYTVTNTSDGPGAGPAGSLRQAISQANTHLGADTITFQSGLSGTIALSSGMLQITDPVTITGPGARHLTVSGNNSSQVFYVGSGATPSTISGLTLSGGKASAGAAVEDLNFGMLTLSQDTISGNTATGSGGGVYTKYASLTVDHSTISGNTAKNGGGVYVELAPSSPVTSVHITDSTIASNHAVNGNGGGIRVLGNATYYPAVSILGSTISGNTATRTSGSNGKGGGLAAYDSFPSLNDTIVSGNTATIKGPDIYNAFTGTYGADVSAAFSLIQNNSGVPINDPVGGSDIFGQDPKLGLLQNNGGPTDTMKPAATSPVVDQGKAFGLADDQRGFLRPVDIPGVANSSATGADGSDMGAVELQASDFPPAVASLLPAAGGPGTSVVLSGRFFSGASKVLFGSTPANFKINGDQQITAVAPGGLTGPVDVRVITAGGESAAVAGDRFTYPNPASVSCQLNVVSHKATARSVLAARKRSARRTPSVSVSCNQDATVSLAVKVTARLKRKGKHRKPKVKTFTLSPLTLSVKANVPKTVAIALPKGALRALKRKARESVAVTLTASNANGTSTAHATIHQLQRVKPRKG